MRRPTAASESVASDAGAGAVHGIVLAAGAGSRMGAPKALLREADGTPWVSRVLDSLRAGGCGSVGVVLGAAAERARGLVPRSATVVVADDWQLGIGASLQAGLRSLDRSSLLAVAIVHVDVPDLPPSVVERMLRDATPTTVRQARFDGRPGHPVVVGAELIASLADSLGGGAGARRWLDAHGVEWIDCDDLFDGADIDTPAELQRRERGR